MTTRAIIVSVIFLATTAYLSRASQPETPLLASLSTVPLQLEGWRGRNEPPFSKEILEVLGADEYLLRTYSSSEALVGLYVGFYKSQRQGDTMHSPLNCLPGAGWQPVQQDRATFSVTNAGGQTAPVTVNKFVIQKGLDKQLVLYWYQSHGRVVASEYTSKFHMIADAIRLNRTDAAMIRVIAPIRGEGAAGEEAATAHAQRFAQSLFPVLTRVLPS